MSRGWPSLLKNADVTRTGSYQFEDPDDKVVRFPDKPEDILADRRKFERMMVDARGDVDLAIRQYNELIELYNESGSRASDVLKNEYGLLAHPTILPKLTLAGPEGDSGIPPEIPNPYKETLHDCDRNKTPEKI